MYTNKEIWNVSYPIFLGLLAQNIINVTDTGCGISADKHEYVFQRFTKLNTFTLGNGLGLYLCRLIARHMNGNIKIDPNWSKGSKFIFTIPMGNNQTE